MKQLARMISITDKQYLLANSSERSLPSGSEYDCPRTRYLWFFKPTVTMSLACCLLLSLLFNMIASWKIILRQSAPDRCRSTYTGLEMTTPIVYKTEWGKNETLMDELWENLDVSPIVVALSHEYAEEHGLARSAPFPWDDEKGIYHIKVFHQLHCLKVIHRAFKEPRISEQYKEHIFHCLNMLRQDIMCKADDTPMPSANEPHSIGNNQVMQCRDWNQLVAWSRHPDHNSCFKLFSDYKPAAHELEQYAFCPEDSPYRPIVKEYFERHGHKLAYDDQLGV